MDYGMGKDTRVHPIGEVLEELYPELVEGKKKSEDK